MQKKNIKKAKKLRLLRNSGMAVLAMLLVVAMVVGLLPGSAVLAADKTADLDTSTKYTESLGNNASTEYAGRIWTDKSVYEDDATFEMFGGNTTTVELEEGEDFLVAYSALATGQEISGNMVTPLDVVFVIDLSNSMKNNYMDNGKNRVYNATVALNNAVKELVGLNDYVRVGVIGYNKTSYVMLPLDHYEQRSGNEFFTCSGSTITINAVGTNNTYRNVQISTQSGTNLQKGIFEGMNMLATESSTTVNMNGTDVKRIPSVILLTDGEPSNASDYQTWWDLSSDNNLMQANNPQSIYGMKALMTASYMKDAIDRNYGGTGAQAATVYSIGMGITGVSSSYRPYAYATINPNDQTLKNSNNSMVEDMQETWEKYANNRTATLGGYTFNHPTTGYDIVPSDKDIDGLYYVDDYYDADDAQSVTDVFDSIVTSISVKAAEVPTELKGNDPVTDGYITYTDKIGQYMTVKDVKEIIYAGETFTRKTTSEANGVTTYTFEGEVHSAIYGEQNIDDIIITVAADADGNETLTVKIPASVIPIRVNSIELNADGTVKTHTNNGAYPARVLYSVSVKEDILTTSNGVQILDTSKISDEYIAANSNEDGTINFYSNLYTGENVVNGMTAGDTTVEFEPAHTNPFYYIQEDMPIYVKNGDGSYTQVSSARELADNETYYYYEEYYNGTNVVKTYIERTGAQLKKTAIINKNGSWYRAAGSPRINRILEFEGTKTQNATNTAEDFYAPTFQYAAESTNAYDGKFVVYLGNNGVLSIASTGNLEISKNVVIPEGANPETDTFKFTVNFNGNDTLEGSFAYVVVNADGSTVSEGTVADGGTIQLKDGQKATINHLPDGTTYEVTEAQEKGFTTETDGTTSGTIEAGKTSVEAFTNTYNVSPVTFPANEGLTGKKVLTGREADENEDTYTFFLTPYNNAPLPEGYNAEAGVSVTLTSGDEDAEFDFGSITFTEPGTYRYTVVEKEPENDEYLPGMTYSRALYRIVVVVTDNGDGTLVADADVQKLYTDDAKELFTYDENNNIVLNDGEEAEDAIVFTNVYSVKDVVRTPVATKTYTDNSGEKPLVSGMFQFELAPVGVVENSKVVENTAAQVPMPEVDGVRQESVVTGNEGQNVTFLPVTFKHSDIPAGQDAITFRYQMKEVVPATPVNGMTYDENVYYIDVTVEVDATSDALIVNSVYPNEERIINFVNEYNPQESNAISLSGEKTLIGRDMKDGETFEFTWEATDEFTSKALNDGAIVVDQAQTEVSGGKDGVAEAFDFGSVTFKRPGTYSFSISEKAGNADGVTYDAVVKYVTVVVTDNNGVLEAVATYNNGTVSDATDKAVFENTYGSSFDTDTAVSLSGTKQLTGKSLLAGEFYFVVKDVTNGTETVVTHTVDDKPENGVYSGAIQFLNNVTYTEAGTYVYEISEQIPANKVAGTVYDESVYRFTVTVTDDQDGRLYVSATKLEVSEDNGNKWAEADEILFENKYAPEPLTVEVSPMHKVIDGSRAIAVQEGEFTFEISVDVANPEDGIVLPEETTVTNDADGYIYFGDITFTKAGTYTVRVKEVIPEGAVKNDDGTYTLDGVTYTATDITATYEVTDNRAGSLTARITSSSGTRTFTNTYKAEGEFDITIKKILTGRDWKETDEFVFETVILDPATQEAYDNGYIIFPTDDKENSNDTINAEDEVLTGKIEIKKAGEYKFVVREISTNPIAGIIYDSTAHEITVKATDNGDGTLKCVITDDHDTDGDAHVITFNNKYVADETEISGHDDLVITKELDGREWLDSDVFEFTLTAEEDYDSVTMGSTSLEVTTANKAHAHFGNITFTKAGKFVFYVTEVEGDLPGVTYDTTPRKVVVDVTDNGNGELIAAISRESAPLVFKNTYDADPAEAVLNVTKELEGRNWKDADAFTFKLIVVPEENVESVIPEEGLTATINGTDADKAAEFDKIVFDKAGVYVFEIVEIAGDESGMQYAMNVVEVTVTVTDDGKGNLEADIEYSQSEEVNGKEAAVFTNTFTPNPEKAAVKARKVLEGRELAAGDFAFRLTAITENAPMPNVTTVTNAADGMVDFGEITFAKEGTYQYEIVEISQGAEGVTYDTGKVEVTVTVSYDASTGELNVDSVSYAKVDAQGNPLATEGAESYTFENSFMGNPGELVGATDLKVTKNFTGRVNDRWLAGDVFEFELAAYDDDTKAAVAAGTVILPETELEVSIDNRNNAHFGNITFTEPGTYTFSVTEKDTGKAGVTYDTTPRIITVVVENTGAPVLSVTVDKDESDVLTFDNTYRAEGTDVTLEATKTLNGRELKEEEFTFELKDADGKVLQTKKNTKAGKVDFDALTFDKAGTYHYTVSEVKGDLGGVTYDETVYEVVVVVTDNGNAQLVATTTILKDGAEVNALSFENTYGAADVPVEIELNGTKTVEGEWEDETFTFYLQKYENGQWNTVSTDTATKEDPAVNFELKETFTAEGTYEYQVIEANRGQTIDGITYDAVMHTFNIVVTDNGNGSLVAEVTSSHGDANHFELAEGVWVNNNINFTNVNNQKQTSILVMIQKDVKNESGSALVSKEGFRFEVYETDENYNVTNETPIVTERTDFSGETYFTKVFDYDQAGTYYYQIKEQASGIDGMIDSTAVYNFKVVVTAQNDGSVKAEVIPEKGTNTATFVNEYDPEDTSVAFEAEKVLKGRTLEDGEFTFVLKDSEGNVLQTKKNAKDGSVDFDAITFDKVGTYNFTVNEARGSLGGVTYDRTVYEVVVTVTDEGGKLAAAVDVVGADAIVFTNVYDTEGTGVILDAAKTLDGRTLEAGEFEFELKDAEGNVLQTKANDASGKVVFDAIEYTAAGEYKYTVSEVKGNLGGVTYDETVYEILVTVTDNGKGQLEKAVVITANGEEADAIAFANAYQAEDTSVVFEADKTLNGRTLDDGEFEFVLKDAEGNVLQTKANDASGNVVFDAIDYDAAGEYRYTVSEVKGDLGGVTYDETVYEVIVTVTDNGKGQLEKVVVITVNGEEADAITFTNAYEVQSAYVNLKAKKFLDGRDLTEGEFEFELKDADGKVLQTKKNNATGNIVFDAIEYNAAGEYRYTVSEVKGNAGGMTYDGTVYEVVVTVTDDGNGQFATDVAITANSAAKDAIEFTNTYDADDTSVTFNAAKTLDGRKLKEGEFTFVLKDRAGIILQEKKNDANGNVTFDAIDYDAAGEYRYTVSEVKGDLAGVTYDETVYDILVTVTDKDGKLAADVNITVNGEEVKAMKFANTYNVTKTDIDLQATKTVTPSEGNSYDLKAGDFTFQLTASESNPEGDPLEDGVTATNGADGVVALVSGAEYTKEGVYVYTVNEVANGKAAISYDSAVYTVTVTVTDVNAQLVADVVITKDGKEVNAITFNNGYDPEEASVVLSGNKVLNGRDLDEGKFTFEISAVTEGAPMPQNVTVKNAASGLFQFDSITYTQVGVYEYEIREVNAGDRGYTYDGTVYKVVVTVTDDVENGALAATVTVDGTAVESTTESIVFTNSYDADDTSVVIDGNKNLEGRDLAAGEFKFVLVENGEVIAKAKNLADGTFAFDAIEYSAAGTYRYTVSEVLGEALGVTYDETVYEVVVEVTDEGGYLAAKVAVMKDGEAADIEFNNSYDAEDTSVEIGGLKNLTGRDLEEGEFAFELLENDEVIAEAVNDAEGVFTFEAITFDAEGTYSYTVREKNTGVEDVIYDETEFEVIITITDKGGYLEADIEILKDGEAAPIAFNNKYEPEVPEKPEEPEKPESNVPKTGDSNNIGLYMTMLIAAFVAIVGTKRYRR